ncbi:MAG: hypothetical protein ACRD4T_14375 [Candidatus Acidiferrales bacterium]
MIERARQHPVFAAVALLLLLFAGSAAASTYRAGLVRIHVTEKKPGGENLHLIVPGILLTNALRLVPDEQLHDSLRDARPWMPLAAAAARELERYPDAAFIEVSGPREHVRIATRAGVLTIDVDSPDETVHLAMPLATLADLTAELAETP